MSERFRVEQVEGNWSVVDAERAMYSPFVSDAAASDKCLKLMLGECGLGTCSWLRMPKVLQVDYLNLSKPCEVYLAGCDTWECVVGVPVFNGCKTNPRYGCYVNGENSLTHFWMPRAQIRNVRELRYETHTMETLLPLANEWIVNTVTGRHYRINGISRSDVLIGNDWISFLGLLKDLTWATGPHAGQPVARVVM